MSLSRNLKEEDAADAELRARLISALKHPLRALILGILAERPASAGEIAVECELSSESVGHQLRRLRREGLIRLEERKGRRGVAENYYRATLEPIIHDEEFATFTSEQRRRFTSQVIKRLSVDAGRAHRAGTFDSRNDMCLAHTRMLLDERGLRELAEIHREACEKVIELRRRAAERIEGSTQAGVPAVSALLCFELPGLAVVSTNGDY